MKLPGIEYKRGVQSLGRESMGPAIRAEQAKATAVLSAINIPADVATFHLKEYHRRQVEIGRETAALGMAEAETQFTKAYGDKEYFSADEIPEEIQGIRRTKIRILPGGEEVEDPRSNIPAYEVRADLYRRHMQQALKAQAENIPQGQERDDWIADSKIAVEQNYGRFVASGIAEQDKVVQTQREARFKVLMQEQKYSLAREIVNNMEITPEEKQVYQTEISKTLETDRYNMSHANMEVDTMQTQIEKLLDPEYRDNGGLLTDDERDQYVTFLRRGIAAAQANDGASDKVAASIFRSDLSSFLNILNQGHPVPPAVMASLNERAVQYPDQSGRVRELNYKNEAAAENLSMIAAGFNFQEIETAIQRNLKDVQEMGDPASISAAYAQQDQLEKARALYDANPIGFAEQYLRVEVAPLTPKNLHAVGAQRAALYDSMLQQLGYAKSPFKPAEEMAFVDYLQNASPTDKMTMANSFRKAFGEGTGYVIERLVNQGAGQDFFVAGDATLRNNPQSAMMIFQGTEAAKNNKSYLGAIRQDLEVRVRDEMPTIYNGSYEVASAHRNAIMNVYTHLALKNGVAEGVINDGLLDQAVQVVVGYKAHEFAGSDVELPPSTTGGQFDNFFKNTHHNYLSNNYKMAGGYNSKTVWDGIVDGRIELISVGPGMYNLVPPDGRAIVDLNTNDPLLFTLDKPRMSQADYFHDHPGERPYVTPSYMEALQGMESKQLPDFRQMKRTK